MSDRGSGSRSSRSSGSRSSRSSGSRSSGSRSEVIINFADKINELIFLVKQLNISNKDVKDNIIIEGILKKDHLIELRNIEKEYKEMKKYINREKAKQKRNAKLHGQKYEYVDMFANKSQQQIFDDYKAMKEEQINEQKFNEEKKRLQKEEREEERKRYREEKEREKEELKQRFADIKLQAKEEKEERKRKKLASLVIDNDDLLQKSLSSSSSSSSSIRRNNLRR
jgi:hypothetical protein